MATRRQPHDLRQQTTKDWTKDMTKFIWIGLIATLAIGCGDIQTQAQPAEVGASTANAFTISAATVGGCEPARACPSYQIIANGSYLYTQPGIFGGPIKTHTGILSANDSSELPRLLTQRRLSNLEESEFTGTCPSYNDGTDYVFKIDFLGQTTNLHSCKNELSNDLLIVQLVEFFNTFSRETMESE
jgi:hypothetical protein